MFRKYQRQNEQKVTECRVPNPPQGQESDWCQTFHLLQKTPNENEQYIQRQKISAYNLHLSKPCIRVK